MRLDLSTLPEDQHGTAELDPIAVAEGRVPATAIAVDVRVGPGAGQAVEDVTACRRLDLGVSARHQGVAEDADLGAFVEPQPASRRATAGRSGPPAGRS